MKQKVAQRLLGVSLAVTAVLQLTACGQVIEQSNVDTGAETGSVGYTEDRGRETNEIMADKSSQEQDPDQQEYGPYQQDNNIAEQSASPYENGTYIYSINNATNIGSIDVSSDIPVGIYNDLDNPVYVDNTLKRLFSFNNSVNFNNFYGTSYTKNVAYKVVCKNEDNNAIQNMRLVAMSKVDDQTVATWSTFTDYKGEAIILNADSTTQIFFSEPYEVVENISDQENLIQSITLRPIEGKSLPDKHVATQVAFVIDNSISGLQEDKLNLLQDSIDKAISNINSNKSIENVYYSTVYTSLEKNSEDDALDLEIKDFEDKKFDIEWNIQDIEHRVDDLLDSLYNNIKKNLKQSIKEEIKDMSDNDKLSYLKNIVSQDDYKEAVSDMEWFDSSSEEERRKALKEFHVHSIDIGEMYNQSTSEYTTDIVAEYVARKQLKDIEDIRYKTDDKTTDDTYEPNKSWATSYADESYFNRATEFIEAIQEKQYITKEEYLSRLKELDTLELQAKELHKQLEDIEHDINIRYEKLYTMQVEQTENSQAFESNIDRVLEIVHSGKANNTSENKSTNNTNHTFNIEALSSVISNDFNWAEDTKQCQTDKIVFVVIDKPLYNMDVTDSIEQTKTKGKSVLEVDALYMLQDIMEQATYNEKIHIVPIVLDKVNRQTELLARFLALGTSSDYLFITSEEEDNSTNGTESIIPEYRVDSLSKAIEDIICKYSGKA